MPVADDRCLHVGSLTSRMELEHRHRLCWYGRRTPHVLPDLCFQTVEDGELLYCFHPMWFPVVRYHFDVRNCEDCDYFKPRPATAPRVSP